MKFMDLNLMSNAELKVKLKEMEFEYEALQSKVRLSLEKMKELDDKYTKVKEIINKRTKGII